MVVEAMHVGEELTRISEEALDDTGYVMSVETGLTTTDGNVKKATATYYETSGVNTRSTKDFNGTAQANVEVPLKIDGKYRVQLAPNASRSTAIAVGDVLCVIDAGKVGHMTDSPLATLLGTVNAANLQKMLKAVVGRAEEAIAASADTADGKILVTLGVQ